MSLNVLWTFLRKSCMNKQEKVCAVVVTYNRKALLVECLEGLLKQTREIASIYLIDNASTDETEKILFEKGYIEALPPQDIDRPWEKTCMVSNLTNTATVAFHYVKMDRNTGGAGGFYEGMKRAYEKGYAWLWLMDDDVEPKSDALEKMLQYRSFSGCIHPVKKYEDGESFAWNGYVCDKYGLIVRERENFKDKGFSIVNYGCFEGMLISRDIIKKAGYPQKEFFLSGDDAYYGYMASKYTNVIYTNQAEFIKKIKKDTKSDMYLFYVNRNFTYFLMEISTYKTVTLLHRVAIAILQSLKYRSLAPLKGFAKGIRGEFDIPYYQ